MDYASKGLFPTELINHPLWWAGPSFLIKNESLWPIKLVELSASSTSVSELKKIHLNIVTKHSALQTLFDDCSSWGKKMNHFIHYKMGNKDSSFRTISLGTRSNDVCDFPGGLTSYVSKST